MAAEQKRKQGRIVKFTPEEWETVLAFFEAEEQWQSTEDEDDQDDFYEEMIALRDDVMDILKRWT